MIGNVFFGGGNGGSQRHALRASGGDFMFNVDQFLLRAAGIVFDGRAAAAERRNLGLRSVVPRHADRRALLHAHSNHHHQDDQNADNVHRHVEKRVGAERFMDFGMLHR